jgi:hypothetical protein
LENDRPEILSKFENLEILGVFALSSDYDPLPKTLTTLLLYSLNSNCVWKDIEELYGRGIRTMKIHHMGLAKLEPNENSCPDLRIYVGGKLWFGKQN